MSGKVKSDKKILEPEPTEPTSETVDKSAVAEWLRAAAGPSLSEDLALALLKRADLPADVLESLAKNTNALKSRKVKIALVGHRHTPRHVSVPLARQLYTFELMRVALSPIVPADIRISFDDILISRLKTVTLGERMTLARRATGKVAAALLLDVEDGDRKTPTDDAGKFDSRKFGNGKRFNTKSLSLETRVMQTALENPRLTEAMVISSVLRPMAKAALVSAVAKHPKWSKRREIRSALLRTEHLSLANALKFGGEIAAPQLREILASSRLPVSTKNQLLRESDARDGAC
jgi:hypothetical protein